MAKVAKLVEVSFRVRVIVDENSTDEQSVIASKPKLQALLDNNEIMDNVVLIEDDEECPFEEKFDSDK